MKFVHDIHDHESLTNCRPVLMASSDRWVVESGKRYCSFAFFKSNQFGHLLVLPKVCRFSGLSERLQSKV